MEYYLAYYYLITAVNVIKNFQNPVFRSEIGRRTVVFTDNELWEGACQIIKFDCFYHNSI